MENTKYENLDINSMIKLYFNLDNEPSELFNNSENINKILNEENVIIVERILVHAKDEIDSSVNKNSLYHIFVILDRIDLIKLCIKYGFKTTNKNKQGYTVVHLAAICSHHDILKMFIEHNVNINTLDNNGYMFSDYFDYNQFPEIKNLLFEKI